MKSPPFPHKAFAPLNECTTLGLGGPARLLAKAQSKEELREMLLFAREERLPFCILGKGSNVCFDDRGFNGLVILNQLSYMHHQKERFCVGSGYSFARLGKLTARLGYHGLEFASGIPATVGGALFMNAGASGQETMERVESVDYMKRDGSFVTYSKEEITFSYRTSCFQKMKGAIVEATFLLEPSHKAKQQQKALLDYRLQTQPYKERSAGCAFRNPAEGVSAAKLIEECGLKALKRGGVEVSSLHSNFLIHTNEGSSQALRLLIDEIKRRVFEEKGILLEEEIQFLPYE